MNNDALKELLNFAWIYCPNTYDSYTALCIEYDTALSNNPEYSNTILDKIEYILMNIAGLYHLYEQYPDETFDMLFSTNDR